MRSNITGSIITAERQNVVAPVHAAFARKETLSFSSVGSNSNAGLDADIPSTWLPVSTGTSAYVIFRYSSGTAYVKVVDTATPSDYSLSNSGASSFTNRTMRSGLINDSGTRRVYTANHSGGGVQLSRSTVSGASNPPSLSFANFGPVFGPAVSDTSSLIRRVEAVCPTTAGVIVGVGTHDFVNLRSTIQFWLVTSGLAVRLNTIIQMSLFETYVNWYSNARYCSFISAVYDPVNLRIVVTANDQVWGRAVSFTVQNGVDSTPKPVVPIDAASSKISLMPVSQSLINGVFYLTCRWSRQNSFTTSGFDCYLTSADGVYWSFGEPSFFICAGKAYGTLLMRNDSPTIVFYSGALLGYSATATKLQSSSSALELDLTNYLIAWSLDQVSNSADKLSLTVWNPSTGGVGLLTQNVNLQKGCTIYLQSGMSSVLADIGAYVIDEISESVSTKGRTVLKISARDLGNCRLIDVNSPLELSWETRYKLSSTLSRLSDLTLMTPEIDITANLVDGWVYTGRNDPAIALTDTSDSADVLMQATITSVGQDATRLSSFGFIFGASQSGEGNVALIPAYSTWNQGGIITGPELRALSLNAVDPEDPKKENTGWLFKPNTNAMWKSNISGSVRTAATTLTSRVTTGFTFAHNVRYDVAARVNGSRVTLYKKQKVTDPSTWATNAFYDTLYEWQFEDAALRAQSDRNYCGLSLSTDVWYDIPVFETSPYDDIEQTLTNAGNYADIADFSLLGVSGSVQSPITDRLYISCSSDPRVNFIVGQFVRLQIPSHSDQILKIASMTAASMTFTTTYAASIGGVNCSVYNLSVYDYWGFLDSGKKNVVATGGLPIPIDPMATKRPRLIVGRSAVVTDDSTAIAMRWIEGDGVWFQLLSGSENGTRLGWDTTNPLPSTSPAQYYGGSDPSTWRMIFHHGYIFDGSPTAKNLPAGGYLDVNEECIRYGAFSFYKRGMTTQRTVTAIPAYYAPLSFAFGPTSTIRNWMKLGNTAVTGDDFKDIPNPVGMLVEITSRSAKQPQNDKQYYVASVTSVASPTISNTSSITLDKQYENTVMGTDSTTLAGNGDIAVVSGRGQFATKKANHEADSPVRYSPREADGTLPTLKVSRFDLFSGEYQSLEDTLRNLAGLAGVRYPRFRQKFSTPTSPVYPVLTTSAYTVPLNESLSNLVLDLRTHIPGWTTNGFGAPTTGNELVISFRGYYQVRISQWATSSDISLGRVGKVRVGLATTSADISAAADGIRWIDGAVVQVSDANLSGSFSGGGPAYTLTEDVSILHDIRLVVQDNIVSLEINDRPVWTFNLDRYITTAGASLKSLSAAPITLAYKSSITGFVTTVGMQEMGDEQSRYILQRGSSVSSGISALTHSRRLRTRAGINGAMDFSRFETRDNAGSLNENMWSDQWRTNNLTQRGHYMVAGNEIGEFFDETLIQSEGYSFAAETGDEVKTSEAATNEAKMLQREALENTQTRVVDGVGILEAQPEDKIILTYAGGGDAPSYTADHVITQVQLQASLNGLTGQYTLRKFIA